MVRKSISLPNEMYYKVKKIAKEEGKSFSAVINEAIDLTITKYKRIKN